MKFCLLLSKKESNTNIFEVLLGTIDDETILQNELLQQNKYRKLLLCDYFRTCEVKTTELLDTIYKKIGSESMKKILKSRTFLKSETVLLEAASQGKNYLLLSKWVFQNFPFELDFVKEVLLARDYRK